MHGSLRQRSAGSWELRVFIGTDPDSGRRIDRSITVRGRRPDAERALADLVASAAQQRMVGPKSLVRELLEPWFEIGATGWSPTTIRQHRSVLRCYLIPRLGHLRVGDVTASMINRL